ncbi:TadE/TadG family type IV pilus assembly protein [Mariniblastus fucicola]|uniref:TadE-like protein n=1 Tax=Mariniblastus fucicola TaxID=980251 RepID=A0A5B9P391_9BACT|nr:TadE/TadG family type IV pilus assembly protein [Mariniblastus fucicola]QEG20858.1 TadE-like protein [Mariniblastus fucicola]
MFKTIKTIKKFRKRNRKGAAAVEFAVVAPAFLAVTFCCFEFARMSIMRNLAQNAAYEACRFAMMEGATEEDGEAKAADVLSRLGTKGATVTTTYQSIFRDDGTVLEDRAFVTTQITVPIGQNSIVFPAAVFGDKAITTQTQLRSERYIGFFETQQ